MKNDTVNKFCICCFSFSMASSSSSFSSSSLDPEPSLEDLINCVSIGKTAFDQVSGKCTVTSTGNLEGAFLQSCIIGGDFDPLALPLKAEAVSSSDPNDSPSHNKRQKQAMGNLLSETFKAPQNEEPPNQTPTNVSIRHDLLKDNVTQRLNRKRRLLYIEDATVSDENNKLNKTNDLQSLNVSSQSSDLQSAHNVLLNEQNKDTSSKLQGQMNDSVVSCQISNETSSLSMNKSESSQINEAGSQILDLHNLSLNESRSSSGEHENLNLTTDSKPHSPSSICNTNVICSGSTVDCHGADIQTDMDNSDDSTFSSQTSMDLTDGDVTVVVNSPDSEDSEVTEEKKSKPSTKKRKSSEPESTSLRKRIRKTLPPAKTRQTPMGLPKPLRIKKNSFSIEEIYTNKNYSTPVPKCLETIFEYPKEDKDGSVKYLEKKRKQRAVYFSTNPADRPVKKRVKSQKKKIKRSTRRASKESGVETDSKLLLKLESLDKQLKINDLSP